MNCPDTARMISWDQIIDILTITVPFITAFGLAWLNAYFSNANTKRETLNKRFNDFYYPFVKKYMELFLYSKNYELSFMDLEIIDEVISLCMDNFYLIDTKSQKYIPKLYRSYLDLSHYRCENPYKLESDYSKEFDNVFNSFTKSVLEEYKYICNKLKFPPPAI